jgi:integrase
MLTGQRRSEVAGARKEELTGLDGSNPIWTIPGDKRIRGKVVEGRTKNGKEQVLPLSSQAAEMFREAIAASDDPEYLFPARMTSVEIGKTPRTPHIHGQSVSGTMRKLRIESGIKDATVHDLRRTMATWMGEQGVRPDVIDLVLHHLPKAQDVTRAL